MKKSILVLTDLTENAAHAAETAAILAGQIGCNLILLYCNNTISAISYYPFVPVEDESATWYEHAKNKLKLLSASLQQKAAREFPDQTQPVIKSLILEGDLLTHLREALRQSQVELIAMGAKSGSSTEHFLFGSDTKTVADHSSVPVMIVPRAAFLRPIIHLTFASNLVDQDIEALSYLSDLRQSLCAELEILHIRQYGQPARPPYSPAKRYIDEICSKKNSLISYKEVYGKKVQSRLYKYCLDNDTDLLALSHHHHSYLALNLREGIVDQSISQQHLPLLIIPEMNSGRKSKAEHYSGLSNIVF